MLQGGEAFAMPLNTGSRAAEPVFLRNVLRLIASRGSLFEECASWNVLEDSRMTRSSEHQLEAELHSPWSHSRAGDGPESRARRVETGAAELRVVPGIECLPAELRVETLAHPEVFEQAHVPVVDAR